VSEKGRKKQTAANDCGQKEGQEEIMVKWGKGRGKREVYEE